MTEITAAMVKELRDATSAGMMECKRALQETDGDFDEAVKLLREKGMASAAKRADRATSEGKVGVMVRDNVGAIAAIGCETEPVSNRRLPRLRGEAPEDRLRRRRHGVHRGGARHARCEARREHPGRGRQAHGGGGGRGPVVLRPLAGEQGRCSRAHEGRRRRCRTQPGAASPIRTPDLREAGGGEIRRSSIELQSATSSPSRKRCSRTSRASARRSSKGS